MKPHLRIVVGLLIIFFGYKAIRQEFSVYEIMIFSEVYYIPIIVVVVLTMITLFFDTSYFKINRKPYHYLFSFIGVAVCLIVFFKIIQRTSVDNSKTILKVVNKAGAKNVWEFNFKNSEHFTLADYNMFGYKIYYGEYQKQGDTLKIIESNYNGDVKELPMKGMIKSDTVFWDKFDTMLIAQK